MHATTRRVVRSIPTCSARPLTTTASRRAAGWDNRPRPGEDTLAYAIKAISSQTRVTLPQAQAYTAILKQASKHAEKYDRPAQSSISEPSVVDSLSFDVAMTVITEAENAGISLEADALAHLAHVSPCQIHRTYLFAYQQLAGNHPEIIPSLLLQAVREDKHPAELYEALALSVPTTNHPDQLVYILLEMLDRDLQPSSSLIRQTVRTCCEWGLPRLALEIVHRIENNSSTRADLACWIDILIVSAERHYVDGVLASWPHATQPRHYSPDSGIISRVMDVAARAGRPELATQALAALGKSGASVEEYHLVALLECYVAAGQVPEAFRVVTMIRDNGLVPTLSTVEPIAAVLQTPELIDQAFYGLEDMHKAGQTVDLASINALILASARIEDLRRVRATQTAISDFGLEADIDTYHTVLDGCIAAAHRPLGDTVLAEMQAAGVAPTASTYEKLIQLCLLPDDYEDAFYYLEKMKAEEFQPSLKVYQAILRRCLRANDRRWELVREETQLLNYVLDFDIRREINDRRQ